MVLIQEGRQYGYSLGNYFNLAELYIFCGFILLEADYLLPMLAPLWRDVRSIAGYADCIRFKPALMSVTLRLSIIVRRRSPSGTQDSVQVLPDVANTQQWHVPTETHTVRWALLTMWRLLAEVRTGCRENLARRRARCREERKVGSTDRSVRQKPLY